MNAIVVAFKPVGREMSLLETVRLELVRVQAQHPEWFADYEDIDPYTAERRFVEELLEASPTEFARGLVTGILLMRQQIALVTGRGF